MFKFTFHNYVDLLRILAVTRIVGLTEEES